jgi:reductive dehalogenase
VGEEKKDKGISRRDLFKIGAIAGAGLQMTGFAGAGLAAGKNKRSYTGWESFEGVTQSFDRKSYELDEYPYKPVGPTRRPDKTTEMQFGRQAAFMPRYMFGWRPENGLDALGEPLASFYQENPEVLEWDLRNLEEFRPKAEEDKKKYGEFFTLAQAYQAGWENNYIYYPPEPQGPPEVSDFKIEGQSMPGQPPKMTDIREPIPFKSPDHAAELIKKMAHIYGASFVGITKLNPLWCYANNVRGGPTGPFEVPKHWEYAIAMGIPQEWDQFLANPTLGSSVDAYCRLRMVSGRLAAFIKTLGYPARSHHPGVEYDLMAVAVAHDAGLGQVGRHGSIILPEVGSNVRLTIVTTNIPMATDKPIDFGVGKFCKTCKICAEDCPSGAISFDETPEKLTTRGWERWRIDTSKCAAYWAQNIGPGGCRLCLAVCPYSRKNNWMHNTSKMVDIKDPTGLVNDGLTWMQKTFFKGPGAQEYLPPPDGRFASYRPPPDHLDFEKWFDVKPRNPQKGE